MLDFLCVKVFTLFTQFIGVIFGDCKGGSLCGSRAIAFCFVDLVSSPIQISFPSDVGLWKNNSREKPGTVWKIGKIFLGVCSWIC